MSALIESLWESGALGGLATTVVSVFGQLSALNSQKWSSVMETLKNQQSADSSAHDFAFVRTKDEDGALFRRVMYFSAFFVLGVCPFIFAFYPDIPVAVETAEECGGWLWGLLPEREKFAVKYVKGFYLASVWQELLANLISAYIGAGLARRAFRLGK